MKKKKPRILVVGSLVMDLITSIEIFPNVGATILGYGFTQAPGGEGCESSHTGLPSWCRCYHGSNNSGSFINNCMSNYFAEEYEMKIDADTQIITIVEMVEEGITYLQKKGIKCIACGEPVWGSLREAAELKNISEEELENIVDELNKMIKQK